MSKGEWGRTEAGGTRDTRCTSSIPFLVSLTLCLAESLYGWVSSYLSASLTLSWGPGPLPSPIVKHSARRSRLRGCWLSGPALSPILALRLPSPFPPLPLLGSVPLNVFPHWCISLHLTSLSHFSVSPSWLLSVFLSPSTTLSLPSLVPPSLVSLHLCLSLSLSLLVSPDPGWVRVGPGQPGLGAAAANNAPFTRPFGAMATRPPRPPRPPRPGCACQEDAMVTSGACPLRPPPPCALLERPGRQGAPGRSLCPESEGASPFMGPSATRPVFLSVNR